MVLLNVPRPVYIRCIKRAAERLGGYAKLGAQLGVSAMLVERWADGVGWPPDDLFLRIVDIVLDDDIHRLRGTSDKANGDGVEPDAA